MGIPGSLVTILLVPCRTQPADCIFPVHRVFRDDGTVNIGLLGRRCAPWCECPAVTSCFHWLWQLSVVVESRAHHHRCLSRQGGSSVGNPEGGGLPPAWPSIGPGGGTGEKIYLEADFRSLPSRGPFSFTYYCSSICPPKNATLHLTEQCLSQISHP